MSAEKLAEERVGICRASWADNVLVRQHISNNKLNKTGLVYAIKAQNFLVYSCIMVCGIYVCTPILQLVL